MQPSTTEAPTPRTAWHAADADEVERQLDTSGHGLSLAEAAARLRRHGPNRLHEAPPPSVFKLLLHQFQSPLIYILIAAAVVTLWLGEVVDAGVIAAVLVLNAVIGFTQERRAEISVRSLMQLVSPRARVVRAGREEEIESRDLVPGDVVLLESGARVPADVRLLSTASLTVDESLLTGESLPASKRPAKVAAETPLAERASMAHMGTVVASGRGRGIVVATGERTELGAIARQVRGEAPGVTPLQQRMTRFAHIITLAVVAAALLSFGLGVAMGESAADMFMLAVALSVAAVPEGLPVVLTITLAVGVRRMARRNAIIRRLPAVETLGSTTVIGSDKTGTLTENRMTVEAIWAAGRTFDLPAGPPAQVLPDGAAWVAGTPALERTLLAAVIANEGEAFLRGQDLQLRGDPTETALLVAAMRLGLDHEDLRGRHRPFAEIPFEPERQYSASIRQEGDRFISFVKGAPERILGMCTAQATASGVGPLDRQAVLAAARAMAGRGLRVLAMAERQHPERPHDPDDVPEPSELVFLGLMGMMDPPRAGVREAIAGCQRAGIRVVMITGDHAATARAIGAQLGIVRDDAAVLTGAELARLDEEGLRQAVREVSIYARVAPDQKLKVVRALQSWGEVVAVTGDGVNDAPALRASDIGVAMGKAGTDVAREAADMVLADDNFVSIHAAVEQGRVTFDNLRKATFFLVSTGAATVATLLVSMLLGWPVPFVPAQLLWLNLVTKGLQDVAMAFEPGDPDVPHRPPRPRREGLLSRLSWERTVVTTLVMAAGTLYLFDWALVRFDQDLTAARTVALTAMVVFQTFHLGNSRSDHESIFRRDPFSNRFLFVAAFGALAVHLAALHLGPTQFVLRVQPIMDLGAWVRIVLVSLTIVAAIELHKLVRRPRWVTGAPPVDVRPPDRRSPRPAQAS